MKLFTKIILLFKTVCCLVVLTFMFKYDGMFNADENVDYIDGEEIESRILKLQRKCGDLCDTNKQIIEGEFLGTVKSEVPASN